jgi:transcriptional regulator with XRE-family HTH domain
VETESSSPETLHEVELLNGSVLQTILGLMDANDVSQRELARRLKVSDARVSRILNGSENLRLSTVAALGRAMGIRFMVAAAPFENPAETPAAGDDPPPRWLAGQRRLVGNTSSVPGMPSRMKT